MTRKRWRQLYLLNAALVTIGLIQLALNLLQLIYKHVASSNNDAMVVLFDYLEQQEFTWRKFVSKRTTASMVGSSLMHLMVVLCMLIGLWSKNSLLLIPQLSLLALKFALCVLTVVVTLAKLDHIQLSERQRWITLGSSLAAAAVNAIFFSLVLIVFVSTRRRTLQRRMVRLLGRSYSTIWSSNSASSNDDQPPTYCSLVPFEEGEAMPPPPPYSLFDKKTNIEEAIHRSCPNLDREVEGGTVQLLPSSTKVRA
ncbi:hypothetical protein D918_04453 [Trichuris suis]